MAQDNSSSSSVAQRCQKVGHPASRGKENLELVDTGLNTQLNTGGKGEKRKLTLSILILPSKSIIERNNLPISCP